MIAKGRISIEEWHESAAYNALTAKQKLSVDSYVASNGDKRFAIEVGRKFKNRNSMIVYANQLFRHPNVLAALSEFYGDTPLETFKKDLVKALHDPHLTTVRLEALKMFARLHKIDLSGRRAKSKAKDEPASASDAPREVFKVGDIVIGQETRKEYRVTAVDELGNVTDVAEVASASVH